jgi:hypothetical protein
VFVVPLEAVPLPVDRLVRPPEPRHVDRDHPSAAREQRLGHLPVEISPRRLAVEAHHRRSTRITLVHVVHPQPVHVDVMRLPRIARQIREALVGGAKHSRQLILSP